MIKLKNVDVNRVMIYDLDGNIKSLITENECYTVADLIKLISKYPNYNWEETKKIIANIEKSVEKNNIKGYEQEIYEYSDILTEDLKKIDQLNNGSILLLDNPTLEIQTKYKQLRPYSIDWIKRSLTLTDEKGRNTIGRLRNIGPDSFPRILNAIQMYDEQMLRQSKLTDKRNYNLFLKDSKIKKEIIEDIYQDIILYLIYTTEEKTIWGNLTDNQKKIYISSALNNKKIDNIVKNRMINIVANYTTLEEVKELTEGNKKVLKRFIEK